MNIIDAIADRNLFSDFLGNDHSTWGNWMSALRCLYGLPVRRKDRVLIRQCTGRQKVSNLPSEGFREALFIIGRRSGKSRTAALIGAFEAVFAGHETKLAPGEQGMVAILAPTRDQAGIVFGYLRAIFQSPMLAAEVVAENSSRFQLRNGITVAVLTGDHKASRGYTICCAIADELAFFGIEESARVKSDTELVRGLKPSLATTGGKFIGITTAWMEVGYVYRQHKRNWGNDKARVLVWNCESRVMNPTLSQKMIDEALAEDPTGARSEWLGQFRKGAMLFISPDMVEALVVKGRVENIPQGNYQYSAFFDASGGRNDSATLGIAHAEDDRLVLDLCREWRSPCNPHAAIRDAARILEQWNIREVSGDRYAGDFPPQTFRAAGIHYICSERNKSQIYLDALPLLCTGKIELLDNERLVHQISNLIRITKSGGQDKVDHAPGAHDDLSNSACGALVCAFLPPGPRVGVWGVGNTGDRVDRFIHGIMNAE
ncbi:MAG: hypothetical protein GWP14_06920 [Actinobacteria bacterium]|nr:hypothetical protein [Actinomycetota bacterium]